MFTRCPVCETTFRLGADDLRRAQGRVRCGECSQVFNALDYIAEEPEATAAPDNWLPEPANDATHPDDNATVEMPAIDPEDFTFEIDLGVADEQADDFETSIFVTEPDDDSEPAVIAGHSNPLLAADSSDVPTPLTETYGGASEAGTTTLWNEALQQHELAESGLDLTALARDDFLSDDELDEATEQDDELTSGQPVARPEPVAINTAADEDFDDTIWERIPGVGSLSYVPGRPIDVDPAEPAEAIPPLKVDAINTDDSDPLEFNAPEETWSKIFVSRAPEAVDDDEGYPELYADDPDNDATAHDKDDQAELERIFNPERIAAALLENNTTRSRLVDADPNAPANNRIEDVSEPQEAMAVWLDEEESTEVVAEDEFPVTGYDVQHIILADESESAAPPRGEQSHDNTAATDDLPTWRNEQPAAPTRSGLWLTGGFVLLLLLAIQLIHYNRDALAASPAWGLPLSRAYALLGIDLFPAWPMDDYEVRSAEAVTGESGPDIMDIRAQIAVVGANPVGYPYLRVVLSDRWSKPVAEKIFGPADYLPADRTADGSLLQPGQTLDAHVSIVDPGAGAQGFELELCLPRRHSGMECTGQPFR